mgnify:CR=1 FL=1
MADSCLDRDARPPQPTLYKCLGPNRTSVNGGVGQWLPPGEWMHAVQGTIVPCYNGYHLCRFENILDWVNEELWEAEGRGDVIEAENKIVFREARLVRRCEWWNPQTAHLFACDCAEQALPIYENRFSDDKRPRNAIEVARRYANREATEEEMAAARAAGAAAWAAAGAAAWSAARAAGAAARAAAGAAAWSAAGATAGAAAWSAGAAGGAARAWQIERLRWYANGEGR